MQNIDVSSKHDDSSMEEDEDDEIFGPSTPEKPKSSSKSTTPVLDNFGRDLTKYATEGRLDPIVGRHKEIERVSELFYLGGMIAFSNFTYDLSSKYLKKS